MRWWLLSVVLLGLQLGAGEGCGPSRGSNRRRGNRRLTPLVFKQHVPNWSEYMLSASGPAENRIAKNDSRFKDLVLNYNPDIIFKDEEGTGADRLMTERCKERLNSLAISVMNQWPTVKLRVTEGWDEDDYHSADSLHYEGRAVDITTSDRDRSKYGMLARLAVEAGFDWVYYESRAHIHCSVKSEPSQSKYGGCFAEETTVRTSDGKRKRVSELRIGEHVLAMDPATNRLVFSEVLLFLDRDPHVRRQFLEVRLASGRLLAMTPTHLIPTVQEHGTRTVFADRLRVGTRVLVSGEDGALREDAVDSVETVWRTGVYAPLTVAGTVVVDDVVASCYATVDSASLAHWVFAPLRLLSNFKQSAYRMWTVLNKPVQVWSTTDAARVRYTDPPNGVHWYAQMLHTVGTFVLPSHMHK